MYGAVFLKQNDFYLPQEGLTLNILHVAVKFSNLPLSRMVQWIMKLCLYSIRSDLLPTFGHLSFFFNPQEKLIFS